MLAPLALSDLLTQVDRD